VLHAGHQRSGRACPAEQALYVGEEGRFVVNRLLQPEDPLQHVYDEECSFGR